MLQGHTRPHASSPLHDSTKIASGRVLSKYRSQPLDQVVLSQLSMTLSLTHTLSSSSSPSSSSSTGLRALSLSLSLSLPRHPRESRCAGARKAGQAQHDRIPPFIL